MASWILADQLIKRKIPFLYF